MPLFGEFVRAFPTETLGDYAPGSDVLADYRELVTAYLEALGLEQA